MTDDPIDSSTYYQMHRVGDSSGYIMLSDSVSKHASFAEGGAGAPIANFRANWTSNWSGMMHLIHKNKANVAFFDGHVDSGTSQYLNANTLTKPRYFVDQYLVDLTLP
jgi:prepilin-type processing-associated H-X9-DG protein